MTQRKLIDPIYVYADPKRRVAEAPILVAVGTAAAATFGPALFGGAFATIGSLGVFTSFLVRAALGVALSALTPKPKAPQVTSSSSGYRVTANGANLDHQIVYGEVRCGGVRVYDAASGSNNSTLHRVLAFTGHEIEGFTKIYANDEELTIDGSGNVTSPSRYSGRMRIYRALGSETQDALPRMVQVAPGWTANHRLRGIAYLYIEMDFNQDVFPNGVPEITALVKGKKVFDPRTGVTAWSDNAALCIRDYFTSDYGLNADASKIDDVLFQVAANICDEVVIDNGIARPRYTCNGNFITGSTPIDIILALITSLGGVAWYSQGKWGLKAAKWTSPVMNIGLEDFRSGIQVVTRNSRRDNFNVVKGTYKGNDTNWQTTDYPSVKESIFINQDQGVEKETDLDLPFTDDPFDCQRLARISLRRNREQMSFSTTLGLRAFELQVGDVVNITNDRYGWSNKPFEVMSWSFTVTEDFDIVFPVSLREVSSAVYDNTDGQAIVNNDTNLPNPFDVPAVGMAVSAAIKQVNEAVLAVVYVDTTASSPFVNEVEVEYKRSADSQWTRVGKGPLGRFEIVGVEDGFYDFRGRSVSIFGIRSATWTEILNRYISPFADPPADVTSFYANVVNGDVHLTWNPVPDLDLSHYKIKYSPLTSNASYSDAIEVVDRVARPANSVVVPARSGTYLIKAVDKLGNQSVNPASTVVFTDVSNIQNLNVLVDMVQHPAFLGNKSDLVLTDVNGNPVLILNTSILFDGLAGNFDDASGLFDGGSGFLAPVGHYEFENYLDLGAKYTSRVSASVISTRVSFSNLFDEEVVSFDSKSGLFDGTSDAFNDSVVSIEVSHTDDDPAGTPLWSSWQPFFVSDISARALRFRAVVMTDDPFITPAISNLSVTIDMPDRVESGENVVFTGSTTVTFNHPFKETPSLGISVANLTSGQRYGILSKTRAGFVVEIRNSDNSLATNSVQMDYVAKGYGRGM